METNAINEATVVWKRQLVLFDGRGKK